MKKMKILFLCTGNSCRSQMAEALVNHRYSQYAIAFSAGTDPKPVHPLAVKALQKLDLDISQQRSKTLDTFSGESFDLTITLCDHAKESCPVSFSGKRRMHVSFKDPAEKKGSEAEIFVEFETVRDAIDEWLHDYFEQMEKEQ